jgi:integrase
MLPRNVAALVTPPRINRKEIRTLSPEESRRFLAAIESDRLEALYVLAVTSGMRQGELLALRWTDVDLEAPAVSVHATLQRTRGSLVFAPPKTSRSRRRVALTRAAVEALRRHRARQGAERLRAGTAWGDPELIFTNEVGQPLHGTYLTKLFQVALVRAGLPRLRFHDLRHTAATLLLGRGVHPKIASEMLGHSSVAITLDLYSHVTPTMQREAATEMDRALKPVSG